MFPALRRPPTAKNILQDAVQPKLATALPHRDLQFKSQATFHHPQYLSNKIQWLSKCNHHILLFRILFSLRFKNQLFTEKYQALKALDTSLIKRLIVHPHGITSITCECHSTSKFHFGFPFHLNPSWLNYFISVFNVDAAQRVRFQRKVLISGFASVSVTKEVCSI